jgi:hypothetical protein
MGLYRDIVEATPVGNRLPFGVVHNVRIINIDTGERRRDGIPIPQNTFITLAQFNEAGDKIIGQSEGSYWNLDPTKEYVESNFLNQFTSLVAIAYAYGEDEVEFDNFVLEIVPDDVTIEDYLKTKDGAKAMQKRLKEAVEKFIVPHVGRDSKLLKCKSIVNKSGFFELGIEENWILPDDDETPLTIITPNERRIYRQSLLESTKKTKAKPDAIGERSIAASSLPSIS